MKTIDFLPPKYRELYAVKRRQLWRTSVLLMFTAIVGSAAAVQHMMRLDAEKQLAECQASHQEAMKINNELALLYGRMDSSKRFADVVTYMRHPWPSTQLLATVVGPVSDDITLTEIHVTQEAVAQKRTERRPRLRVQENAAAKKNPAQIDLETLRQQRDQSYTTIYISGVTTDIGALHSYVGMLSVSSFCESAELASLESHPEAANETSKFRVQLRIRHGYGQSKGPTGQDTAQLDRRRS